MASTTNADAPVDADIARLTPRLARREGLEAVYRSVEYAIGSGVEGDVAEFGTMSGDTAVALAKGLRDFGGVLGYADVANGFGTRTLHLFDSFEGLPESEADRDSPHVAAGLWSAGTCRGISPEALRQRCAEYVEDDRIRVYRGWFRDTLLSLPPGVRLAVLHIDSDLYTSAYEVLDHVFGADLLSDGGVILFDDWDCNRASPRFGERRAFAEIRAKYTLDVSDAGGYGFAARRFIVHRHD